MKYIVIVPDGMADNPVEELGNRTPLEAAVTTNMDYLARSGTTGLVKTIPDQMSPGSDIGNMAILGYDPRTCHTGRAPLEAANLNIVLADNEVAFRCNLVTVTNDEMADYSAGHIRTNEASLLIDALNGDIGLKGAKFYAGKGYRHVLVLAVEDPKAYCAIKTTPPHDILGKNITPYLPKGPEAGILLKLMDMSKEVFEHSAVNQVRIDLGENPANMIWLWGQGTRPNLPLFHKKFGLKGSIISAVDLVNGIGRLAGLDVINVPGATGYYDTNYLGKAEYALESLKTKDFVYIHIEATDEAGHNGDIKAKVNAIEQIDKHIVGTILNHYNEHDNVRILVLPDHPTPVKLRTHTADPVCFVMYGKGIPHDGSQEFNENTAREKGLKFDSGEALLNHFITKYL
ncbi:MAG: cofactor-independent phosphoglycerate mutase [Omnitrophica WOR_2 bacterium RIFCSPHIGHO2_02_FULL_52_10]|nr:MAG: cofactor-independent phosphoglycerate mutase [Omnitrophica WOR_2 bacterium RIFCSPHIGHO2_02_FULL_52_10]